MTRNYLLETLVDCRNALQACNFKPEADEADDMIVSLLDAGLLWQPWVPCIHSFVAETDRLLGDA